MTRRMIYAVSFVLSAGGLLWPLWPLSVVGIALAALSGRWIFAILTALLLDAAWGLPTGVLHYVYAPFTLLAIALSLGRYFFADYFLDRSPPDTL